MPSKLAPGALVGDRFEIEALAGRGNAAYVHRARDRVTGERVALKLLRRDAGQALQRFIVEAKLLLQIDHPAVVRYIAHDTLEDGTPYLVLEWAEGQTLRERLRRGRLSHEETVALGRRVADALGALHVRGAVHRDVKPTNIVLCGGSAGDAKLLDLGVAHWEGNDARITTTGAMVGTPSYMAPEQVRAVDTVGASADVFSLGCVLYECVTGVRAFGGDDILAVLTKILFDDPPTVASLRPDAPPALADLIDRMIAKPPEQRPPHGGAVAADLSRIQADPEGDGQAVSSMLTRVEQRLMSAVLAAPAAEGRAHAAALARLTPSIEALGGRPELLADGSVLVTTRVGVAAHDGAAIAARCARALREGWPEAPIALLSNWQPVGGGGVAEVIDRGVALLRASTPPQIALDRTTVALLSGKFTIVAEGDALHLGSEVRAADAAPTLLGRKTPFVGRPFEQRALKASLDDCVLERTASAVLVAGPIGVGKSRLCRELLGYMAREHPQARAWIARGSPTTSASPYRMVTDLLAGAESPPPPDGATASADPLPTAERLRRAFTSWLSAECDAHPTLLLLEDAHWMDQASLDAVDAALAASGKRPLMVLATSRPEASRKLLSRRSDTRFVHLTLRRLSQDECEVIAAVLSESVDGAERSRLCKLSGGNPLYLEELLRATVEGERPRRAGRRVPDTVLALVQNRLEHLGDDARRVLRAASIFGDVFSAEGVVRLLGGPARAGDVAASIRELTDRDLLVSRGVPPLSEQLEFRHPLVREAAYATLTGRDLEVGHRLAAKWLEAAGETDPIVLAIHYEHGGAPDRAGSWYQRAARQSLLGNELDEALRRAARAAACGLEGEALGEVELLRSIVLSRKGDVAGARSKAAEALRRLPHGAGSWHQAVEQACRVASSLGKADAVARLCDELKRVRLKRGASPAQAVAWIRTATELLALGRRRRADSMLPAIEAISAELLEQGPAAAAALLALRARIAWGAGELETSMALATDAAASYAEAADVRGALLERVHCARVAIRLGTFGGATAILRAARTEAQAANDSEALAAAARELSRLHAQSGAFERARQSLQEAGTAYETTGERRGAWAVRVEAARTDLAAGESATRLRGQLLELLEELPKDDPITAAAHAVLCRVRLAARARDALGHGLAAKAMLEAGRVDPGEEAYVRLAHVLALRAARDPSATAALAEAAARLLAIAESLGDSRQSFLRQVPEHAELLDLHAGMARARGAAKRS